MINRNQPLHTPFAQLLVALLLTRGVAGGCRVADDARASAAAPRPHFTLTYEDTLAESYTGRVYVMLSGRKHLDPLHLPRWFGSDPFVAVDVREWKPGEPLEIKAENALSYPVSLDGIPAGNYRVRAIMRLNRQTPSIGRGAGNACSGIEELVLGEGSDGNLKLHIDERIEAAPLPDVPNIHWVEHESELLSEFFASPVTMKAAVIVPEDHEDDPRREHPALYWIGGFGSDHSAAPFIARMWGDLVADEGFVIVVLDPLCFGGHHVFADSANNGPRGTALVEELIPHLQERFRLIDTPEARLLSGISSGGWSSLWLQIAWPDFFGGVWSFAPDPIDFTDFQGINLYAEGANMYEDEAGRPSPIAHHNGEPFGWYHDFAAMEAVYGEGGQLRSFEWVFSPRGEDGLPRELFDRESGEVNAEVAEAWKRYDIRLILEEKWADLEAELAGKLHVFVGDQDTFYLDGAVAEVKEVLERLGADADIEIHAGADHGSIMNRPMRERAMREMAEAVRAVGVVQ